MENEFERIEFGSRDDAIYVRDLINEKHTTLTAKYLRQFDDNLRVSHIVVFIERGTA